jgi:hypothetical protein
MDSTQFAAVVGTIGAAIGGVLTWASTQGINALLKYRADKREDERLQVQREDAHEDKEENTLRFIIGRQDGELTSLRSEIKEMQFAHREELRVIHNAHNECEKRHAELATELRLRMELMNSRVEVVERDVKSELGAKAEIVQEIAKTRHNLKDDLNAVSLKVQAAIQAHDSGILNPGDVTVAPKDQPK